MGLADKQVPKVLILKEMGEKEKNCKVFICFYLNLLKLSLNCPKFKPKWGK